MPATKKGIYHNLKESEYAVSNREIAFYFSSRLYQEKFLNEYETHREKFNRKLTNAISEHNHLNFDTLSDISLYKMIEKRGFRACLKGAELSWQDTQKYALRKMTERNTLNWRKVPKQKSAERGKITGWI